MKNAAFPLFVFFLFSTILKPETGKGDDSFPRKRSSGGSKPNIIFILTDDHRWDALGAMGNKIIRTPNLDKLAAEGVLFQNAYVTTSICCVSRASILTGQYMSRHKVNDFVTDLSPEAVEETYPILMKKAGYKIGFIGKYGVGRKNLPAQQYDYWSCSPKAQPDYLLKDKSGNIVHNTDSVERDVTKFLGKFGNKGPFCLSISFKAPHEQDATAEHPPLFIAQERYKSLYQDVNIPEPVTADPKYWNSFPDFFRTDQNIGRVRWKPLFSTNELYQQTVKDYYRLISGVDGAVGDIIARLKKLGIDKNTVIVFMGDNGFYLGEHGLEGKWYGHEESIRVPLIVYDPRLPAGERGVRSGLIALNIDIAPTLLAAAGLKVPSGMQGVNLIDMLEKQIPERKDFFYEHTHLGTPRIPKVEGVVTGDFKYMKYIEHGYEELYNVKTDPHETNNLANDPQFRSKLEELRLRYAALRKSVQ